MFKLLSGYVENVTKEVEALGDGWTCLSMAATQSNGFPRIYILLQRDDRFEQ